MWWGQRAGEVAGQREHDVELDAVDAGHERRELHDAEHGLDGLWLVDDSELDGHGHERLGHGLGVEHAVDRIDGLFDGLLDDAVVDQHVVDHDAGADHDEHRREEDAAEEEVIAI